MAVGAIMPPRAKSAVAASSARYWPRQPWAGARFDAQQVCASAGLLRIQARWSRLERGRRRPPVPWKSKCRLSAKAMGLTHMCL